MKAKRASIEMISEMISSMKAFERYLTNDTPKFLSKVEKYVGKDEGRSRQFSKHKAAIDDVRAKWEKNKAEFRANADPKKAVVLQNTLYSLLTQKQQRRVFLAGRHAGDAGLQPAEVRRAARRRHPPDPQVVCRHAGTRRT